MANLTLYDYFTFYGPLIQITFVFHAVCPVNVGLVKGGNLVGIETRHKWPRTLVELCTNGFVLSLRVTNQSE